MLLADIRDYIGTLYMDDEKVYSGMLPVKRRRV